MNIFNPPSSSDSTATANNKQPVSLLTLPRVELIGPSNSVPQSLLLQLPLHWTVEDFINHSSPGHPSTYFVSNRDEPSQQVACVVESKGASFTVHRVETSNVLVLVPPSSYTNGDVEMNNINDISTDDKQGYGTDPPDNNITQHIPAQLLKTGGSGAFFLELRPKRLRCAELRAALPTLDPTNFYATPLVGRTLRGLAESLLVSQREVQRGLALIQAFPMPRTHPTQFALFTDSVVQDCFHAILDGLILFGTPSEDYAGVGIKEAAPFVDFVVQQVFSDEERFPDLDCLILYCLSTLQTIPLDNPDTPSWSTISNQERYILDLTQVAKATARRLFLKHPEPWNEVDFFTAWQSELPGKGALYHVQRTMLRGVAVFTGKELDETEDLENGTLCPERLWHFLPVESMSPEPTTCFATLFALKERWCMYELEPYLDHLAEASSSTSSAELLLRHSKLIREDHGGVARTFYQKK